MPDPAEVVITIGPSSVEERSRFMDDLRGFLRGRPEVIADPELVPHDVPSSPASPFDEAYLPADYNWVMSCRIPPNTEDEFEGEDLANRVAPLPPE